MDPNPVTATRADPPPAPGQPLNVDIPQAKPKRHPVRTFFNALGPIIVIGSILAFVYYSLVLYKPSNHRACGNAIEQQADIAAHVIRQWAGKEGQEYAGCTQ